MWGPGQASGGKWFRAFSGLRNSLVHGSRGLGIRRGLMGSGQSLYCLCSFFTEFGINQTHQNMISSVPHLPLEEQTPPLELHIFV